MKDKLLKALQWFFHSFIWLGIILLVLDIVTKNVVIANREAILSPKPTRPDGGVDIIPGFLGINYVINNNLMMGISFGNDTSNRIFFIVIASIVSIALVVFMVLKWGKLNKMYRAIFMMVLAGAFGNLIDRIFYSPEYLGNSVNGVVDWIDFYGIWGFNFNIADSSVVIAAIMLIIYVIVVEIIGYRNKSKEEIKEDNTKVLSKTEQEKNQYLESSKDKNE